MPRLIGLTGRAGAGKTYVAESLAIATDHAYMPASFAMTLRYEIEDELERSLDVLFRKPTKESVRRLLQWWGTDYRRAQDENYWVNKAFEYYDDDQDLVFDDVRFPNEAEAIRERGGLVVRVLAPIDIREKRLGTLPPEHASETAMDEWPVDMHITSTEDNPVFEGQLMRILFEATVDDAMRAVQRSLDNAG